MAHMLLNARNTFTTRLVRALAWNMPSHAEHHLMPNVLLNRLSRRQAHLPIAADRSLAVTRASLARGRA